MTRPRNEPPWCAGGHGMPRWLHKSVEVTVGPDRHHGNGQAFAYLQQGLDGPVWVGVGVAHMASASVELSLDDARRFRDALDWLIEQAEAAQRAG